MLVQCYLVTSTTNLTPNLITDERYSIFHLFYVKPNPENKEFWHPVKWRLIRNLSGLHQHRPSAVPQYCNFGNTSSGFETGFFPISTLGVLALKSKKQLHWKCVSIKELSSPWDSEPVDQGSQTVALQMFLAYSSQKPSAPLLLARISGSWSPRTSGGPQFETPVLEVQGAWLVMPPE